MRNIEFYSAELNCVQILNGDRTTSRVLELLSRSRHASSEKVAWIEATITLNPTALTKAGLRIPNFTFFECGTELEWVTHEVFQSNIFQKIVLVLDCTLEARLVCLLNEKARAFGVQIFILGHDQRKLYRSNSAAIEYQSNYAALS